jgi:photosystem II oxygen-evolving enhancer protein 1
MKFRGLIAALMAVCIGFLTSCSDAPANATSSKPLTYEQIRNTGLANNCPTIADISRGSIDLDDSKKYRFVEMCLQPTDYFVKEEPLNKRQEPEFIAGKVVTRATSSLDQISGSISIDSGKLVFTEEDGIDFQAITVKMPGGELVPFLFTIKELTASSEGPVTALNTSTDFSGDFKVPSYRGSVFLDPKGRGVASGYDNAVALPAESDSTKLTRTNVKNSNSGRGHIVFEVSKVNSNTGEVAGIFESEQPSDTDLGADDPKEVRVRGLFYTRLETKA